MARERPRPVLTGRALVFGGLVVVLVVLLAAPVNRYLASRQAVSAAAAKLHHDHARLDRLSTQKHRWSDPGYIQRQARDRLQYAMPGDTTYVVVDKHQHSALARTSGPRHTREGANWNTRLWNSVRAAG